MLRENRFSESRCRRYQSSTVMIPFLVIATLLNILLGVLALKKGFHTSVNRWFAVLCFSMALWLFSNIFLALQIPQFFDALTMTFATGNIVIASSVAFVLSFTKHKKNKKYALFLFGFFVVMDILFLSTDLMIRPGTGTSEGWAIGQLYGLYSTTVIVSLLWNVILLIRYWKFSKGIEKKRAFHVIVAFFATSLIIIIFDYVLPLIGYYQFSVADISAATFFTIFLYYAVIRYTLLDIRVLFRKSLVQTTSTLILLLLVSIAVYKYADQFIQLYDFRQKDFYFLIFTIFIVLLNPLQFVVRKVVDKFIFSEKIDLFHATNKAGFLESKSQDLRDYSEKAREFMMQKMHAFDCELLIWDEDEKQYQQYYQSGRHIVLLPSDPVLQILQRAKRHFFTEDLRRYAEQEGLEPEVIKTCLRKLHALNASIVVPLIVHDALLGLFLINVDTKDIDISDIQISGFAIEVSRGLSACLLMNYRDYIKI